jgi:hypothetical protein
MCPFGVFEARLSLARGRRRRALVGTSSLYGGGRERMMEPAGVPVCVLGEMRACRGGGCVALCSLNSNRISDEGAAAISRGLASVPQLQRLEYVVAVCALVVPLRRRDPVTQGMRGRGASVRAECVGVRGWGACVCGATCVVVCACGVVWRCAAWAGTASGPRVQRPSAAAWPVCPSCKG